MNTQNWEGAGGMLPQKIFTKLDTLRLLLGPFWDRSLAIVATWSTEYCIQFLDAIRYMHLLKSTDIKFSQEKVLVGRTAGGMTDGEIVCREYVRRVSSDSMQDVYRLPQYTVCLHAFSVKCFDSRLHIGCMQYTLDLWAM